MAKYEDALSAIHKSFNNPKRPPKSKTDMKWEPPEGSCDMCGNINVFRNDLCEPCWKLDIHRRERG